MEKDPMFRDFKAYESRPITRMAMEIEDVSRVTYLEANTYSYMGIRFKAYQPPQAGDYICRLTMDDTYHVSRAVMAERNFLDGSGMDFGAALVAMKRGARVARTGWNGSGMFVFLVSGSTFAVNRAPLLGIFPEGTQVNYRPHMDIRCADGSIATWAPSGSDALAEDWVIVE